MLDAASSQTDIDQIKEKIRQTIIQMEQENAWTKHVGQGGNQY